MAVAEDQPLVNTRGERDSEGSLVGACDERDCLTRMSPDECGLGVALDLLQPFHGRHEESGLGHLDAVGEENKASLDSRKHRETTKHNGGPPA